MHIHGGPSTVHAIDGINLFKTARFDADTVDVGPGQRDDVIWTARKPGKWLLHATSRTAPTNNNVEDHGGGELMLTIERHLTNRLGSNNLGVENQPDCSPPRTDRHVGSNPSATSFPQCAAQPVR